VFPLVEYERGTNFWPMSAWCVSEPRETRLTAEMLAASGDDTVKFAPYVVEPDAELMVGRAPAKR
jgi:hypothetical protein